LAIAENRKILKIYSTENEFFGSRKMKLIAAENWHPYTHSSCWSWEYNIAAYEGISVSVSLIVQQIAKIT